MKLPRNLSGEDLVKSLRTFGYMPTRQVGSHRRLTTQAGGEHHVTIPMHDHLRVGTLASIVADVGQHFQLTRENVLKKLFG